MSCTVQPSSATMERSDSGPGTSGQDSVKLKQQPSPSQVATPAKTDGGPWSFQNLGSLPSFTPVSQGSAMNFLNADSVPDVAGVPLPYATLPVKPIGTGVTTTPSMGEANDLVVGPAFTTDTDINIGQSRFVRVGGIPIHWLENGHLGTSLDLSGISSEILSYGLRPEPYNTLSLYLHFDDLRNAAASQDKFAMIHSTATFQYIDHHAYYAVDLHNPRATSISAYDGQIEFIAFPNQGMRGFNLLESFEQMLAFAKKFGEVRSFAFIEDAEFGPPHFRAEYFAISAAEGAAKPNEVKHKVVASNTYTATIQQYSPPGYRRYSHPAVSPDNMEELEAGFNGLNVSEDQLVPFHMDPFHESSTKRTAWNGNKALVRQYLGGSNDFSPSRGGRQSFDVSRRGRGNGVGPRGNGRGGKWGWMAPRDESIPWKLDNKKWIKNQPQTVDLEKIERGIDVRTTVMLRNIPNRTQFEDLKDFLDITSYGEYDFSYLRIDFSNNCNVGYAFVNFTRPEHIVKFVHKRVGKPWGIFNSEKRCEVSYATIQGIDCLLAKFRNSVVMEEYPGFRPKLWYTYDSDDVPADKMIGDEAPFPPPDNEQKRKRSRDNASTVGLFPPRYGKGQGHRDAHFRDGKFDRGTPHALEEERRYEEAHHMGYCDELEDDSVGFYQDPYPHGDRRDYGYQDQVDPQVIQPPLRR